MKYLYNLIQRVLLYFIDPVLLRRAQSEMESHTNVINGLSKDVTQWLAATHEWTKTTLEQHMAALSALQALDVTFHEQGHIIILAKVNGKDIVKVIRCPIHMPLGEYRTLTEHLEKRYGLSSRRISIPSGIVASELMEGA